MAQFESTPDYPPPLRDTLLHGPKWRIVQTLGSPYTPDDTIYLFDDKGAVHLFKYAGLLGAKSEKVKD